MSVLIYFNWWGKKSEIKDLNFTTKTNLFLLVEPEIYDRRFEFHFWNLFYAQDKTCQVCF